MRVLRAGWPRTTHSDGTTSSDGWGPAGIRRCARARMAGRSAGRGAARDARGHADGCKQRGERERHRRRGVDVDVDVVVVGAGFAGLYMLHRLRGLGVSTTVLEAGDDVGGTWYWNRYPGARCDIPTTDYTYSWDPELETGVDVVGEVRHAARDPALPQHVADKHDLRRDIRFGDAGARRRRGTTRRRRGRSRPAPATRSRCRWYVMATGCLSVPKELDIEGTDRFQGDVYFTSRWPHEGVDLTGKRVGVIGTGSSGIQSIPIMAQQAAEMVVFQRTPNFSIPARNGAAVAGAPRPDRRRPRGLPRGRQVVARRRADRAPVDRDRRDAHAEEQLAPPRGRLRRAASCSAILGVFADQATNKAANDIVAEFLRDKIRSIVERPRDRRGAVPEGPPVRHQAAVPRHRLLRDVQPAARPARRPAQDADHDRSPRPASRPPTRRSSSTSSCYATGFDAMTGAIVGVDITGDDGVTLKDKWAHGPTTYLGLTTTGFPNLFMITGPGSPSVLSNMAVSIEQHVDWIADQHRRPARRRASSASSRPRPPRPAGSSTSTTAPTSRSTRRPTRGTWAPTCPASRACSCPTSAASTATARSCDEVVEQEFLGFELAGPGRLAGQRRRHPPAAARRADGARR